MTHFDAMIVSEEVEDFAFLLRWFVRDSYHEKLVQGRNSAIAIAKLAQEIVIDNPDLEEIFVQNMHLVAVFKLKPEAEDQLSTELKTFRQLAPSALLRHINSLRTEQKFEIMEKFCTLKLMEKQNAAC